jgi:glutamate/aspartate transport system substrate-binding protein
VIGNRESSLPLSYLDNDGQPVGFSVELCRNVADAVRAKLGMPGLKTAFVTVTSATRIPLMRNGTVDIECGSTVNHLTRQKQVAFSVTTLPVQKQILTKVDSGIRGIDDLKGKSVAITQGTDTLELFNKLNRERGLDPKVVQGKDHAESVLLASTGRAVAFVDDSVLMAAFRATASDPKAWAVVPGNPDIDPYTPMFRKDDPAFKALVDETVVGLMKSGRFAEIYARWFEPSIPPRGVNFQSPMPDSLKALIADPSDKARM